MIKYVLLAVCVARLAAATHQEYFSAPATPGHRGECYDPKAGKYAKLGDTWTTAGCKLATCIERKNPVGELQLSIAEDSCPAVVVTPGCRQTAYSRNKKFPDCCPKLRCRKTTGGKTVTIPGRRRY